MPAEIKVASPARAWLDETPEDFAARLGALAGAAGVSRAAALGPAWARALKRWLFQRGILEPERMSDLPLALREALAAAKPPFLTSREVERRSAPDGTVKLLLELADGERVETVNMPGSSGPTLCVSTQVGCAVGCLFCASGLAGLRRNLSSGEILEQFVRGNALRPIRRAVVMGIGEPSMNLEATLRALDAVHDPSGLDLGARKITISTIGFPAKIARLAEHPRRYQLAVSLHAADQALRDHLVPLARSVRLEELHAALRDYFAKTGRELTLEYVLLRGVNDAESQARDLARWMTGLRATVNLIPFNPVDEAPFRRPRREDVEAFAAALARNGITATVRWSKGVEGDAACGQLRVRAEHRKAEPSSPAAEQGTC